MAQQITDQIKSEITISLNKIIQNGDYDAILNFFSDFYNFFVKSTETFENYTECFEFIESFAQDYGNYLRSQLPSYSKSSNVKGVVITSPFKSNALIPAINAVVPLLKTERLSNFKKEHNFSSSNLSNFPLFERILDSQIDSNKQFKSLSGGRNGFVIFILFKISTLNPFSRIHCKISKYSVSARSFKSKE